MSGGGVRISRGSRVPLRRQIAVQLASAIGQGETPPGRRLPSTRALARRLGVHRGTVRAAYRELARQGLVRLRRGSGTYVGGEAVLPVDPAASARSGSSVPADASRAPGLASFLAVERAAGRSAAAIARDVARWREELAARRLLVVTREPALRSILVRELRPALPRLSIESLGWARVSGAGIGREPVGRGETREEEPVRERGPGLTADGELPPGLLVVPAALAAEARRRLPPWKEVVSVCLGDDGTTRELLERARGDSLVAVVSASAWLRRRVRALAAGLRGEDVGVAASRPGDRRRVERITRVASLVLADAIAAPRIADRVARGRGELHRAPVLPEHSISELVQYLREDADRPIPGPRGRS